MNCIVCSRPLPDLAIEHGDEFCTNTCCRAYHGFALPILRRSYDDACGGCSGSLDARTPGCDACTRRHRKRALGEAARGRSGEAVRVAASPSDADAYDAELLAALEDEAA